MTKDDMALMTSVTGLLVNIIRNLIAHSTVNQKEANQDLAVAIGGLMELAERCGLGLSSSNDGGMTN